MAETKSFRQTGDIYASTASCTNAVFAEFSDGVKIQQP